MKARIPVVRIVSALVVLTLCLYIGSLRVSASISAKESEEMPFSRSAHDLQLNERNAIEGTKESSTTRDTSKLKIVRFQIDDDSVGQSRGNSNGIIDANEQVQISVAVKNVSQTVQTNLVIHVQTTNSNIVLQNNILEIGSLQPGATWNQVNQYIVAVANNNVQLNDVSDFVFYTTQNNQEIHREKFVANLNSPFLMNSIADSWYTTNSYQADMDMAYDSKGEAYAVWADTRYNFDQTDILFAKTTTGGFAFTQPVQVSTTSGYVNTAPKIRINNQDEIIISWVFQANHDNYYDIYTILSKDFGATFTSPVKVTNPQTSYSTYFPKYFNYDLGGYDNNVYVVWPTVINAAAYTGSMYLSTSTNDGLSFISIPLPHMPQPGQYIYPYLDVHDGSLLLSYINQFETPSGALTAYFMKSSDGGQTFSSPREFPTVDDAFHSHPRAFVDDTETTQFVWNEQPAPMNFSYYAQSKDGGLTFDYTKRINSTLYGYSQDSPALVSLNTKKLVATHGEFHSDGYSIFTSSDSGQSFSDRIRLTTLNVNDFFSNRYDLTRVKTSAVPFWEDFDMSIFGNVLSSISYGETGENIQTIGMNAGWNYVALKVQPFETLMAEKLLLAANTQGNLCDQVARWNAQSANWQIFPGGANFPIDSYEGYFVRCTGYSNYLLRGEPLSFSVANLPFLSGSSTGLFSFGVPVNDVYTAKSLCDAIASNSQKECVMLYRWENGGWDGYLPGPNINNFELRMGRGYFVQLKMKGTKAQSVPIKPLP